MTTVMRRHRRTIPLLAFVLALACTMSSAPVSAQLLEFCEVTAAPDLDFGTIDPLSTTPHDVTGSITVRCQALLSLGAVIDICLNLEAGSGGADAQGRYLGGAGGTLPFNVYRDPARVQVWGSDAHFAPGQLLGQVRLTGVLGLLLKEGSTTIPVYARIPANVGAAGAGTYVSDFSGQASLRYSLLSAAACSGSTHGFGFTVRATVPKSCRVAADPLDFGQRGLINRPVDAQSQIRVRCNQGVAYSVALDPGSAPGATLASRRMQPVAGAHPGIAYQLYRDAVRSQVWGDGSAGTAAATGVGNGEDQVHAVYGRVPAQRSPAPGAYRDTVVVTVTY